MRPTALVAVAALTCGVLTGCTYPNTAANDLCRQYDDVVTSANQLLALDPSTANVSDLRGHAQDLETQLEELQAVSENRLDSAVSSLRTAIDDLVASSVDSAGGAIHVTRPALRDARKEIRKAWAVVELMALHECARS
jgi:hypothetical protein